MQSAPNKAQGSTDGMKGMKRTTNITAILTVIAAGLAFSLSGCKGNSPVTPEAETVANQKALHLIKLGENITSLNRGSNTVSAWMTEKDGGELEIVRGAAFAENQADNTIEREYATVDYGTVSGLKVKLDVMSCCLKENTELSMTLENQFLDMEFGPCGTVFEKPVRLNITAVGLDLSEVNEETLDLYYDNPDTGQWEKVVNEGIEIFKPSGYLRVLNAELPHFSRYAVGWGQ